MAMHAKILLLVCLACAGQAREVQLPNGRTRGNTTSSGRQSDERVRIPTNSKAFASLLLAHDPVAGWQVTGAGLGPMSRLALPAARSTPAAVPAIHATKPGARRTSGSPKLFYDPDNPTQVSDLDKIADVFLYVFLLGIAVLTVYALVVTLQDKGENFGGWSKREEEEEEIEPETFVQKRFDPTTGVWTEKTVIVPKEEKKGARIGRVAKEDEESLNRYQKRMIKKRKAAMKAEKKAAKRERASRKSDVKMMLADSLYDEAEAMPRRRLFPRLLPRLTQLIAMLSTAVTPGHLIARNALDAARDAALAQEWMQNLPMADFLHSDGLPARRHGSSDASEDTGY